MNILKEYIREALLKEQEEYMEIEDNEKKYTYKELYDFLRFVKHGKNAKKAVGFVASVTGGAALEGVMNLSQYAAGNITKALANVTEESASKVLDAFLKKFDLPRGNPLRVLAKFYGVNDAEGLKGIAIPNNISNLIDDKVEEAFISNLLKELKEESDKNPGKFVDKTFVLEKLKEFTSSIYDKTSGSFASTN